MILIKFLEKSWTIIVDGFDRFFEKIMDIVHGFDRFFEKKSWIIVHGFDRFFEKIMDYSSWF